MDIYVNTYFIKENSLKIESTDPLTGKQTTVDAGGCVKTLIVNGNDLTPEIFHSLEKEVSDGPNGFSGIKKLGYVNWDFLWLIYINSQGFLRKQNIGYMSNLDNVLRKKVFTEQIFVLD